MAESTAKKSATKKWVAKTTAKKTTAKKTTAKKTPAKRAPRQRSAGKKSAGADSSAPRESATSPSGESDGRPTPRKARARTEPRRRSRGSGEREQSGSGGSGIASTARTVVRDMTGKEPESVTGIERRDDGWSVEVEVLELQRIPTTTDVLATYQVDLDGDGELQGYRRVQRYLRGSPGGDRS